MLEVDALSGVLNGGPLWHSFELTVVGGTNSSSVYIWILCSLSTACIHYIDWWGLLVM